VNGDTLAPFRALVEFREKEKKRVEELGILMAVEEGQIPEDRDEYHDSASSEDEDDEPEVLDEDRLEVKEM
jgi:hypothetical protein